MLECKSVLIGASSFMPFVYDGANTHIVKLFGEIHFVPNNFCFFAYRESVKFLTLLFHYHADRYCEIFQ